MEILMIAILGLASIGGYLLMGRAMRANAANQTALSDLANRHGWSCEHTKATARTAARTDISDPAAGWTLSIFAAAGESTTRWVDPSLSLNSGMALYAPPLPEKTREMAGKMMEKMGGMGRVIIDTFAKGLGPEAADMRLVDDDDDPATLLATPGQEDAFAGLRGSSDLTLLNAFGSNIANSPILCRDPSSLSLRINRAIRSPGEIEAFVTAGLTLSAAVKSAEIA